MQITRYHKKSCFAMISVVILIFYMVFSISNNNYDIDGIIKNTKPEIVWEYVADFSKMKLLNPTIINFKITADAGTYDHWKYSVIYTEKLSHWPYSYHVANADYVIQKKLQPNGQQLYIVESQHKTCFLSGFYCLYSYGAFKFSAVGADTHCIENVQYQCPPFMSQLCRREVEFQRRAIMHNLTSHFHKNNN